MKKTILVLGIALIMGASLGAASDAATLEKSKEVKKACKADYKKHCRKVKAGEGRIVTCLREHNAKLSPGCQTALSK